MSRELKFRVWDKRTNKMSLVANISFGDDGSARTIMAELAPKGEYYNAIVHGENGILMQFTGLKDKNGQEIYEGDIVQVEGYAVGSIQYGKAVFFVDFADGRKLALEDTCQEWLKVLSNMYEMGLEGSAQ